MHRLLAALALVACSAPIGLAADAKPAPDFWPQFRGPNRDDHSPDKDLLKEWPKGGPPLAWKAEGIGDGYSTVSLAGGRIYTMGDKGDSSYVFALDKDGKSLWEAKVGKSGGGGGYPGPRCTPTVDGNLVFALNQYGDLVCLDAAKGTEIWRKDFTKDFKGRAGKWGYAESPLVDGDLLICTPGGSEATLLALKKKTGEVEWKARALGGSSAGYSSIVIAEVGKIRHYVTLLANGVVGVSAKDGKELWTYGDSRNRFAGNTANIPTCIVRGDQVFCSAGYGRGGGLVHLKAGDGKIEASEEYFQSSLNNRHGGVVAVGDYLYGDTDHSGRPWCASWKDGKITQGWQKINTPGRQSASVTYADGHLYFRYQNGYVALVEATPDAYTEKGSLKIGNVSGPSWPHPVVVGGKLYLRERDVLWCYDVAKK